MRNWILTDLCDDHLIESIERNTTEHLLFFASRHPKMDVVMQDDFILIDTKIPSYSFNYVCTTRFVPEDIEYRIERTVDYFKQQNLPFSWVIGPTVPLESFGHLLEKQGLFKQEHSSCMTLNLHHLKKKLRYIPHFRVQQALTKRSIKDVGSIYSKVYEESEAVMAYFEQVSMLAFHSSDPIRLFVGYFDEKPAIVGELYLGAGIAGMRCKISVDYKEHEKELLTDLVVKMLLQAKEQGYHWAVIQANQAEKPYFSQIGFKHYCEFFRYQ